MKGSNNRRQYFTEAELTKLISAARKGRYGHRNATLILIMARHGLRVTEAIDLQWDQIDFTRAHLHVRRLKGGIASVHPIQGDELRTLRELRRQSQGAFVFASERGGPMTRFNVSKMIEAADERAGLPYAHPHMLRHTCGHLLADAGHDTRRLQLWLGHVDIKHTAHYSELSARPFKEFWKISCVLDCAARGDRRIADGQCMTGWARSNHRPFLADCAGFNDDGRSHAPPLSTTLVYRRSRSLVRRKRMAPIKCIEAKFPDFAKSGWQAEPLRLSDHFR